MFLGKTVPLGKTVLLDLSTWVHKQKGEGGGGGGVGWGFNGNGLASYPEKQSSCIFISYHLAAKRDLFSHYSD